MMVLLRAIQTSSKITQIFKGKTHSAKQMLPSERGCNEKRDSEMLPRLQVEHVDRQIGVSPVGIRFKDFVARSTKRISHHNPL